MLRYSPSNWIGTDFDVGKAFAVETADYVEYKYAQLVTHGIIDKHSGFPKLEGQIIKPLNEDNIVWRLTVAAVKRYRYASDEAAECDPEDDIDPLVWQCQERNNELHSVQIKRLSKVTAAHQAGLTDQEKERIVARSYDGRSTIVLPGHEEQGRVEDRGTKASNKGAENPEDQNEDNEPTHANPTPSSRSCKRKADSENTQEQVLPRKRVHTNLGARTFFAGHVLDPSTREACGRRMTRQSIQDLDASRHLLSIVASPTASETIDKESLRIEDALAGKGVAEAKLDSSGAHGATEEAQHPNTDEEDCQEEAQVAVIIEDMRSSAPRTWQAMMDMKSAELSESDGEDSQEDTAAAEMVDQMRKNAPRTWRAIMEVKDAELGISTPQKDLTVHASSIEARRLHKNEGNGATGGQ